MTIIGELTEKDIISYVSQAPEYNKSKNIQVTIFDRDKDHISCETFDEFNLRLRHTLTPTNTSTRPVNEQIELFRGFWQEELFWMPYLYQLYGERYSTFIKEKMLQGVESSTRRSYITSIFEEDYLKKWKEVSSTIWSDIPKKVSDKTTKEDRPFVINKL